MSHATAPEHIDFHGLPAVRITAPDGAQATVLHYGGHIVSWKPKSGGERLYLSPDAIYDRSLPIRGGVPVCFPQFGGYGPLASHGFARKMDWQLIDARSGDDYAIAHLRLTHNDATLSEWPHPFALELAVSISGERLDIEMDVLNDGDTTFNFTTALHTYLAVKEVEECALDGLRGQQCLDTLTQKRYRESGTSLIVEQEVDRIYYNTCNALLLREPKKALAIHTENMPDTVVWNPWVERCKQISDMPDNGFRRMLCVEAAVIDKPVVLPPQGSWWGRQTLMAL